MSSSQPPAGGPNIGGSKPLAATLLERSLLLWLILLGLLAHQWRGWFPDAWDPFVGTEPYKGYIFAVTMLAIGSLLPRDEVRQVLRRWPTVLGGTAIQYTSMPLLAYAIGRLFGLADDWMIGIMMVGCVPGAMASNVLTLAARGNVSYSVSLTTSATLFSPLVVPFALWLALRKWITPDPLAISWNLTWMVVLPVVAGHLLSRYLAVWQRVAGYAAAIIANLTILWIIAIVVGVNRDKLTGLSTQIWLALAALLALNLGGYLAGTLGGSLLRLPLPMRRALTLEVGMQNAGLGTVLAMDHFGEFPAAAIPPAIYTFGCMLTGTILAQWWAALAAREKDTP